MKKDYPLIKSRCEKVMRTMDLGHDKKTEDALYGLYNQLYKHFTLGVKVEEVIKVQDRPG